MGVDCKVFFPPDVEIEDIGIAIGRLLGLKLVPRSMIGRTRLHEIAEIKIVPTYHKMARGMTTHSFGYGLIAIRLDESHYAKEAYLCPFWSLQSRDYIYNKPAVYFSWSSSPLRIAIAFKLARFFGGTVVWNDCLDMKENHEVFNRECITDEWGMISDDGDSWHEYHEQLYAIPPLTTADIEKYRHLAAYDEGL